LVVNGRSDRAFFDIGECELLMKAAIQRARTGAFHPEAVIALE
jgi:hypothetical protein